MMIDRTAIADRERKLEALGMFLKSIRERGNITQKNMAALAGYDKHAIISLVERGHTQIPVNKMRDFAKAYYQCFGYGSDSFYDFLLALIVRNTHPEIWETFCDLRKLSPGEPIEKVNQDVASWVMGLKMEEAMLEMLGGSLLF
jgi:transcriptional regulator with XRE-family HTH domain